VPRPRRFRDTDWTPSDEDFPEARGDVETLEDSSACATDERGRYEGYEQSSGQSWLANDVIIGSLPDNKLKTALARYRSLVRLCESELAARACAPRKPVANRRRVRAPSVYDASVARKKARGQHQVTLTPMQMLKALEMLMKLKERQT